MQGLHTGQNTAGHGIVGTHTTSTNMQALSLAADKTTLQHSAQRSVDALHHAGSMHTGAPPRAVPPRTSTPCAHLEEKESSVTCAVSHALVFMRVLAKTEHGCKTSQQNHLQLHCRHNKELLLPPLAACIMHPGALQNCAKLSCTPWQQHLSPEIQNLVVTI